MRRGTSRRLPWELRRRDWDLLLLVPFGLEFNIGIGYPWGVGVPGTANDNEGGQWSHQQPPAFAVLIVAT